MVQRGRFAVCALPAEPRAAYQQYAAQCECHSFRTAFLPASVDQQHTGRNQHQQRVQRDDEIIGQVRRGEVNGDGKQDKAESVFDGIHPIACLRQDMPAERADGNQRNAYAQRQSVKCQTA